MSNVTVHIRACLITLLVTLIPNSLVVHGQSQQAENVTPLQRLEAERQARVAEMWETGEFEKDHGGMIPMSVLQQGRTLAGPVRLDPLRRGEFDAWCARMELTETVPAETIGTIETIWRNYANRINRVLLEKYPPVFDLSAFAVAERGPKSRAAAAAYEEAMNLFKAARRDVARTEDQMFRMLATVDQGQFAPQIESWQRYRRWERSMHSFHPEVSGVAGAGIHLSRLLDTLEIDWPNAHIQHAYELEIASAVERLASQYVMSSAKLLTIHAEGFFDARDERYEIGSPEAIAAYRGSQDSLRPLRRQQWRHQRAVYSINARYLTLLSVLLDSNDAERVLDMFVSEALPEYFPNPYDLRRWFDLVLDDETIATNLRRDLSNLRQTYVTAQRGVDESVIRIIHRQLGDFFVARAYHPDVRERQIRELKEEIERRRIANAFVFARYLVELLDGHDRFNWVKDELEEMLGVNLDRAW